MAAENVGPFTGSLKLTCISGANLISMDSNGFSDPYVKLSFGDKEHAKSKVISKTLNPNWNSEVIELPFDNKEYALIQVKDDDKFGHNDPMGKYHLPIDELLDGVPHDMTLMLVRDGGLDTSKLGSITVKAHFMNRGAPFPVVFGVSLFSVMQKQEDHPHLAVPRVMDVLCARVLQLNGPTTEGIFRVPGDALEIKRLKRALNLGDYTAVEKCTEVNDVAGVLKLWCRDLPAPLIPDELYETCLETEANALQSLASIPGLNMKIIRELLRFLAVFAAPEAAEVSKMTADNLAMVFGPSLLRADDPMKMMTDTKKINAFVKLLLIETMAMPLPSIPFGWRVAIDSGCSFFVNDAGQKLWTRPVGSEVDHTDTAALSVATQSVVEEAPAPTSFSVVSEEVPDAQYTRKGVPVPKEKVERVWKAFLEADADRSGAIDLEELGPLMKALGRDVENDVLEKIIVNGDRNGDGVLDFHEFVCLLHWKLAGANSHCAHANCTSQQTVEDGLCPAHRCSACGRDKSSLANLCAKCAPRCKHPGCARPPNTTGLLCSAHFCARCEGDKSSLVTLCHQCQPFCHRGGNVLCEGKPASADFLFCSAHQCACGRGKSSSAPTCPGCEPAEM